MDGSNIYAPPPPQPQHPSLQQPWGSAYHPIYNPHGYRAWHGLGKRNRSFLQIILVFIGVAALVLLGINLGYTIHTNNKINNSNNNAMMAFASGGGARIVTGDSASASEVFTNKGIATQKDLDSKGGGVKASGATDSSGFFPDEALDETDSDGAHERFLVHAKKEGLLKDTVDPHNNARLGAPHILVPHDSKEMCALLHLNAQSKKEDDDDEEPVARGSFCIRSGVAVRWSFQFEDPDDTLIAMFVKGPFQGGAQHMLSLGKEINEATGVMEGRLMTTKDDPSVKETINQIAANPHLFYLIAHTRHHAKGTQPAYLPEIPSERLNK